MAEFQMPFIKCDFCMTQRPVSVNDGMSEKARICKFGVFHICSNCLGDAFLLVSACLGGVWSSLKQPSDGEYNGRVVRLIKKMCEVALHEQVGGAKTE